MNSKELSYPSDGPERRIRHSVGRPPILSASQIVDAAIEIGVGNLTMSKVADRLGVSVTALYRHVGSREDLVKLASDKEALRLFDHRVSGQGWLELCLWHAELSYGFFFDHPYTVGLLLEGGLGPSVWVGRREFFVAELCGQGLSMTHAVTVTTTVGHMALGAAIAALHRQAAAGDEPQYAELVASAIDDLGHANPAREPFDGRSAEFQKAHAAYDWLTELRTILEALAVHLGLPTT